jgi:hypothetical protein
MYYNLPVEIGFWYSETEPFYPKPVANKSTFSKEELEDIEKYLTSEEHYVTQYKGFSLCRICNKMNGTKSLSDGKFIWPSGYIHYIREHKIWVPEFFIQHIFSQIENPNIKHQDRLLRLRVRNLLKKLPTYNITEELELVKKSLEEW